MTEAHLPPGLVMWPAGDNKLNRLCVLISDVHCTDCTVGNQTASETDWQMFFQELLFACHHPANKTPAEDAAQDLDELLLILNGDIVDLIRSSKWAESGVYPWHRDNPRFAENVLAIMHDIVAIHANPPAAAKHAPYSGFFYRLRQTVSELRASGIAVTIIPIVGNHDKELQVVPAAREIFYDQCLGLKAADIPQNYREWVAAQLGTALDDEYPCLPFYFVDSGLRLMATHGQWRDADNSRITPHWRPSQGWQPKHWRQEQYRAFSEPCFGDTIAAGMLSLFIWSTTRTISKETPGARRICRLLDELDLYRPTVSAVVRLLTESRRMARQDSSEQGIHDQVLQCFRASLAAWIAHKITWRSARPIMRLGLGFIYSLRHLHWYWLDVLLLRVMAKVQEPESDITAVALLHLPAFHHAYRSLGLRLHVEGHTHVALEADLQFLKPEKHRSNYTYVNLGAWRDRIVDKRNTGFRRRGIGRALFIFDLAKATASASCDAYHFYIRDMTSWGDRRDHW